MTMRAALGRALDARSRPVQVFFRDDDAGWSHDHLCRLLDVFADSECPVDLAVIPEATDARLQRMLGERTQPLGLHQHGYGHHNHEPQGRKCEFGDSRERDAQLQDLRAGQHLLGAAFGGRIDPIFTPPWNRCTSTTLQCLIELDFMAISRDSSAGRPCAHGLAEIPITLDWNKAADRTHRMLQVLGHEPVVGYMLHHAVMDEAARGQLAEVLEILVTHPMVKVRRMLDLLEQPLRPVVRC